ncbi:MAG: hypothetical protein JO227_14320 [Acetobacteraceae bacterium]|nr:hypothetical protein [Acetobacteraceae bacterium]
MTDFGDDYARQLVELAQGADSSDRVGEQLAIQERIGSYEIAQRPFLASLFKAYRNVVALVPLPIRRLLGTHTIFVCRLRP